MWRSFERGKTPAHERNVIPTNRRPVVDERIRKWLKMSRAELDEIYSNASAGEIPNGDTRGTAIVTGSMFSKSIALFARLFAWEGKVFDIFAPGADAGVLINKVSYFSVHSLLPRSIDRRAGWMEKTPSSSTTQRPLSSRRRFEMRSEK